MTTLCCWEMVSRGGAAGGAVLSVVPAAKSASPDSRKAYPFVPFGLDADVLRLEMS